MTAVLSSEFEDSCAFVLPFDAQNDICRLTAESSMEGYLILNFSFFEFLNFKFKLFHFRFNIELDFKWSLPAIIAIMCINKYALGQIPRWNGAAIFYSATFAHSLTFIMLLLNVVPLIARKPKIKD